MNAQSLALCAAVLAALGCGRSELDYDDDASITPNVLDVRDVADVPDRPDVADVPDRPDVQCTTDSQCDNRNVCDGLERCVSGRCTVGVPTRCDDGIACTNDSCDPAAGCQNFAVDSLCSNGRFCDGAERCAIGVGCVPGTPVFCGSDAMCSRAACNEMTRSCVRTPRDDDGDGFSATVCGGGDCDDSNARVNPGLPEVCGDGLDNNCDGLTDCADRMCAGTPVCGMCVPTGPEADPRSCSDRRDNDCDGLVDCGDPGCRGVPPCAMCVPTGPESGGMNCVDGRDNDCNGLTDCADPACRMFPSCLMCVPTGPEADPMSCADGRDNDCDGATDCADSNCAMTPACVAPPVNDVCERATVISVPGRAVGSTAAARDDYSPGCGSREAPDVAYVLRNPIRQTLVIDTIGSSYDTVLGVYRGDCATGSLIRCDDDGAGAGLNSRVIIDNAEPGTYFIVVDGWSNNRGAYVLNVSTRVPENCGNGVDDDGDGLIDCMDADCSADPRCFMCVPSPEVDPVTCSDGRDNDCDGAVDCADTDCARQPRCCRPTAREITPATCSDGVDNDCNGVADCADPGCASQPSCCRPTALENTPAACTDGRDNDCDGTIDCADSQCSPLPVCGAPVPNDTCAGAVALSVPGRVTGSTAGARNDYSPGCGSGMAPDVAYVIRNPVRQTLVIDTIGSAYDTVLGIYRDACTPMSLVRCDDDGAGVGVTSRVVIDNAEPGTYFIVVDGFGGSNGAFALNVSTVIREVCTNRIDDDRDGLIDCADPDCAADPACRCVPTGTENNPMTCADGRDNDCNGLSDCADPGCARIPMCCRPTGAESGPVACFDGRDNDCDGLIDCADPQCASQPRCCRPTGMREVGVTQCTDGVDNDCDGVADCADSDCRPSLAMGSECCNGRDDNGNSLIDEFACACDVMSQCASVGVGGPFPSTACWNTTFRVCAPRCDLLGGDSFCARFFAGTRCDRVTGECHL